MVVRTAALDDAQLSHALVVSYWRHNAVAELAALDQLRSYLAADPYDRGQRVARLILTLCTTWATAQARRDSVGVQAWIDARVPQGPRADAGAYEAVCDALANELRLPAAGFSFLLMWLRDADLGGALRLCREAAWVAASICWPPT